MTVGMRFATRLGLLLVIGSLAAGPLRAQQLGQGAGGGDVDWIRVGGALLLCLVLALAAALVLRKRMGGGSPVFSSPATRRLHLLETLRVGHQVQICLVRFDSRELLVAIAPHGIELLVGAQGEASPEAPQ